jgi:hypothetical protein
LENSRKTRAISNVSNPFRVQRLEAATKRCGDKRNFSAHNTNYFNSQSALNKKILKNFLMMGRGGVMLNYRFVSREVCRQIAVPAALQSAPVHITGDPENNR